MPLEYPMTIKRIASTLYLALFLMSGLVMTSSIAQAKGKDSAPGAAASQCAKEADPKKKDDCVRAANEARKGDKKAKKNKEKGEKKGNEAKKEKKPRKGKKKKKKKN
jgi:hypothetical protein